jgi:HAD superfamily hydrolase (TIGR01509 family)
MSSQQGALLLDCDGVIVHSEPLNFVCWNDAYDQCFGVRLAGDYRQIVGLDIEGIHALWGRKLKKQGNPLGEEEKQQLLTVKNDFFSQRISDHLRPVEGIYDLMQRARLQGWPLAVVSAALQRRLLLTLQAVGLEQAADLILSGEDMLPGPEPCKDYERAAAAFSLPPQACIVVEDSGTGIRAARKAGIGYIYGLTTTYDAATLYKEGADLVVNSLREVNLKKPFLP